MGSVRIVNSPNQVLAMFVEAVFHTHIHPSFTWIILYGYIAGLLLLVGILCTHTVSDKVYCVTHTVSDKWIGTGLTCQTKAGALSKEVAVTAAVVSIVFFCIIHQWIWASHSS